MAAQMRNRIIWGAVNISLIFSLLLTSNVLADGPTDPPAEATVTPPVEESTSDVSPDEDVITDTLVVADLLQNLPENTDLIVTVDDQITPLATNTAIDAISVGIRFGALKAHCQPLPQMDVHLLTRAWNLSLMTLIIPSSLHLQQTVQSGSCQELMHPSLILS